MRNLEDLNAALDALIKAHPELIPVRRIAGEVPWRGRTGGIKGLARIITGQQLSVASASAIWERFKAIWPAPSPESLLELKEEEMRMTGLSAGKIKTLRMIASEILNGLDLDALNTLSADEIRARLTSLKGIGPWSADIYIMFCMGHPDCFAPGDLALRKAVSMAFERDPVIDEKELAKISQAWSPYRTAAAWLFWQYYRACKSRSGIGL